MPKLDYLGIGDILKAEALPLSRAVITAPEGTKAGQLVPYTPRTTGTATFYLVALTDEEQGKVVVQPHNCVVNLDVIAESEIIGKFVKGESGAKLTLDKLREAGDAYGIVYIGTPKK